MKLSLDGVMWGGPDSNWYYVYWWNWLERDQRYIGYDGIYYDGMNHSFGLWFTNISWMTPWW